MTVVRLGVRTIDPIENVEQSIHSSQSYEAADKHLHVSVLSKHDELRKECNTFQKDTESPEIFHPVIYGGKGSEKKARPQYFYIVRGPDVLTGRVGRSSGFTETHRIHDSAGRENVEHLKDEKVVAVDAAVVKGSEEV
jgi:hypothetical protein